MKIAVLLRRVPDTTAKIVIGASGTSIDETGVKFVLNPYDEYAIEAALALKEQAGAGETVALALGGDAVQETLRTALAMGIDRAIHLQGDASSDGLKNAVVLADQLRGGGYDLILCGKLAVDDYGQQTGPMIAELLEVPCATAITQLEVADGRAHVAREVEGGIEPASCRAAGGVHLRQGAQHAAAAVAQGNHGGEEEAIRGGAGDGCGRCVAHRGTGVAGRARAGTDRG